MKNGMALQSERWASSTTIWLFNSSPWKDPPIFQFGKPSISMGHLCHGYVSHNQRLYHLDIMAMENNHS